MQTVNVGILAALTVLNAVAQGTVRFDNNIPGVLLTHVYASHPATQDRVNGNGPSDYPPGDMDWSGWTLAAGSGFSAQLLGAPGANVDYGSLTPVSPITTFQTGANAGFVVPLIAKLDGIPADAAVATLVMVAWDNRNGTINTWEQALYFSPIRWGGHGPFNVYNIGGSLNPPPVLTGLRSFSLSDFNVIPEPSSLTLVGCGLFVLLAFRRNAPSG